MEKDIVGSNLKLWPKWRQSFRNLKTLDRKDIPDTFGVYIIATDQALMRCRGKDERGILTIGESVNLRKRIFQFLNCAKESNPNKPKYYRGHTAGWRYRELGMSSEFPLGKLVVTWKTASSKEEAYDLEGKCLGAYLKKYFEQPPLNYKSNRSAD